MPSYHVLILVQDIRRLTDARFGRGVEGQRHRESEALEVCSACAAYARRLIIVEPGRRIKSAKYINLICASHLEEVGDGEANEGEG